VSLLQINALLSCREKLLDSFMPPRKHVGLQPDHVSPKTLSDLHAYTTLSLPSENARPQELSTADAQSPRANLP
jgi:hypothetical protein